MSAITGICKTDISWPKAVALCVPVVGYFVSVHQALTSLKAQKERLGKLSQLKDQCDSLDNRVTLLKNQVDIAAQKLQDARQQQPIDGALEASLQGEINQLSSEATQIDQQCRDDQQEIEKLKGSQDDSTRKLRLLSKLGIVRGFVALALIVTLAVAHVLVGPLALIFAGISLMALGLNMIILAAVPDPDSPRQRLIRALQGASNALQGASAGLARV
ncbi:MAG TPA: hypothetical protein VLE89_07050 [Chlamydiales bacterium]|nr:hypothetical protein [Chlamydiales bacterium]